jgi:threonine dehydrogenase-like Zn-dependent dehydrogenase
VVRITKTTICGTDLHILKGDVPTCVPATVLGHEGIQKRHAYHSRLKTWVRRFYGVAP